MSSSYESDEDGLRGILVVAPVLVSSLLDQMVNGNHSIMHHGLGREPPFLPPRLQVGVLLYNKWCKMDGYQEQ